MLKHDNYLKILKDEERLKNNRLVWEGENKWTQYIQQEFQNQTGGTLYYQINRNEFHIHTNLRKIKKEYNLKEKKFPNSALCSTHSSSQSAPTILNHLVDLIFF